MTASVQPLGEYPELPRPTIIATVQDIEQLKRRCAMLEAVNACLQGELDAARTARDTANMRETGSKP